MFKNSGLCSGSCSKNNSFVRMTSGAIFWTRIKNNQGQCFNYSYRRQQLMEVLLLQVMSTLFKKNLFSSPQIVFVSSMEKKNLITQTYSRYRNCWMVWRCCFFLRNSIHTQKITWKCIVFFLLVRTRTRAVVQPNQTKQTTPWPL